MKKRALLTALLLVGTTGCLAQSPIGFFNEGAFYSTSGNYRVRYTDANPENGLMSGPWQIANFESNDEGLMIADRGPETQTNYDLSVLEPRLQRQMIVTGARYDLRFTHENNRSAIWARTIALPAAWEHAPMEHLVQHAVASISDRRSAPDVVGTMISARGAQLLSVDEANVTIDGRDGYAMTFDVVTSPTDRRRLTIIGIRPPGSWTFVRRIRAPMMVVFAHISEPDDHEAETEAFHDLIRRVDFAPET